MEKRWVFPEPQQPGPVEALAAELKIAAELSALLCGRNIDSFEKSRLFFRPLMEQLHDPFLMNDMDLAVKRISEAILYNEKIMVFGDYDVDGTTAVSLVYTYLSGIHPDVCYYIPNRYTEGYGISYQGIDWAEANQITLIIALDCGIKSVEHIAYATQKNIDFIIADHHLPGDQLPAAIAVLDPKRLDSTYPFKELSGCGIGYKLVTALNTFLKLPAFENGLYLDMVAVSIASDMVEVTGENRVLAHFGLERINSSPCQGLKALLKIAGIKSQVTFSEVLFQLGPRINAAGRMNEGTLVVELLTGTDYNQALEMATEINAHNEARKEEDKSITLKALEQIKTIPDWETRKSTVLYYPDWHKGVVGIVASRVIEKHFRPTIILTGSQLKDSGTTAIKASGSARSVPGFNIYAAIEACQHLLEQFGGHEFAAGLTLDIEKVDAFREEFEKVVSSSISDSSLSRDLKIDQEIELSKLDGKFFRIHDLFSPFGPGNPQPVFISRNLNCVTESIQLIKDEHLKFMISTGGNNLPCIGFNLRRYYADLMDGRSFDLCYSLGKNIWKDKTTWQLEIRDLKIHRELPVEETSHTGKTPDNTPHNPSI